MPPGMVSSTWKARFVVWALPLLTDALAVVVFAA